MLCYIHGSFMNDNFGDFLIYDITVSTCKKAFDQSNIFSADVDNSYDKYTSVNRMKKMKAVKKSNISIITGGGYFGEINKPIYRHYWNFRFLFRHALPLLYLANNDKKYIIVGLGVGPLSWPISRICAKHILENAQLVILRDKESLEYAKNNLNVSRQIAVYPDMVLGADLSRYLVENEWVNKILEQSHHCMAVHLTTKNKNNGRGISLVLGDLNRFVTEHGDEWSYYIICDQSGKKRKSRAKKICDELICSGANAKVVSYEGPCKLCSLINNMDVVVTDKLHVGIVATKLGKYVVSTAAHQKTKRFYDQMQRGKYTIRLRDLKEGMIYNLLQEFYLCNGALNDISAFEEKARGYENEIVKFINSLNG